MTVSARPHRPAPQDSTPPLTRREVTKVLPDDRSGLADVVQKLSLARSLDAIVDIVRKAARRLTGADGATFVLRERQGDEHVCFYVDEDAIGPLWKGRRFPASSCISGWAMKHRCPVAIEDVFSDARIPIDAYSPTFVKSLVCVPIRKARPSGAIGVYWATRHAASDEEMGLLQALADSTSVAIESVTLHSELERMSAQTADLAAAREQLLEVGRRKQQLAALLAHDIKNPASGMMLSAQMHLREDDMSDDERRAWTSVDACAQTIARFATNMVDLSRSESGAFDTARRRLDVASVLDEVERLMRPLAEVRKQRLEMGHDGGAAVLADRDVLVRVLVNLVENALGHNPRGGTVRVEIVPEGEDVVFTVADEGSGIPVAQREHVFEPYVRLDSPDAPRTGRGLGLSFCRMAVDAHGGRIWIEDNTPRGSRFCVRLTRA